MEETTAPLPECNHHNCPLKLYKGIKKKKINYPDDRAVAEDKICPVCGQICRGLGYVNHMRMKHKLVYNKTGKKNPPTPNTNSLSSSFKVLSTEKKTNPGNSDPSETGTFDTSIIDVLRKMIRKELKDESLLQLHFSSIMHLQDHPTYKLGEEYGTIKIDSKSAAIIDQKFPRALKEIFGFQSFLWKSSTGSYTDNNLVRINKCRIPLLDIAMVFAMFNNAHSDSLV